MNQHFLLNPLRLIILAVLMTGLFCGCASEKVRKGKGNVGEFILQHAIEYGATPVSTNDLPVFTDKWTYSEDTHGIAISLPQSEYKTMNDFLHQAFGPPQYGPVDTQLGHGLQQFRFGSSGGGIQFCSDVDSALTSVILLHPIAIEKQQQAH
jgi:hypothetical protein